MNDFYTRRLLVRVIASLVGGVGFVVWLLVKSCWTEVRSPCTHAVTADDLSALKAGTWKINALNDIKTACSVTYAYEGLEGMPVEVALDADGKAYIRWTKDLVDTRALSAVPDALTGTDPEDQRPTIIIRRPQGTIFLHAEPDALTAAQLEQLAARVAQRFADIDAFFALED